MIPGRRPIRLGGYGVDVSAMSFELHEWDIHALCFGTGDDRVTGVRLPTLQRPRRGGKADREPGVGLAHDLSAGAGHRLAQRDQDRQLTSALS